MDEWAGEGSSVGRVRAEGEMWCGHTHAEPQGKSHAGARRWGVFVCVCAHTCVETQTFHRLSGVRVKMGGNLAVHVQSPEMCHPIPSILHLELYMKKINMYTKIWPKIKNKNPIYYRIICRK